MGLPSPSEWLITVLQPSFIPMALAALFKVGTGDEGLSQGGRFSTTDKAEKKADPLCKISHKLFSFPM